MSLRRSADPQVARFYELWTSELAGTALYRSLAEHADEHRKPIFLSLAEAEERHAAHWARVLQEHGVTKLKPPRLPFRVRVLKMLANRFGTESVLPIVLRSEAVDADKYRGIAEAPAAMAAQEAGHGRVVAAIARWRHRGRPDRRVGGSSPRQRRWRAPAHGVRRQRRARLQLLARDGRRRRHVVQQLRAPRRDRGHRGRRVLDGLGRVALGAFAARAVRERAAHRARRAGRAFPEEEREELELIYQAKGIDPVEAKALVDNIMMRPDVALDTLAR